RSIIHHHLLLALVYISHSDSERPAASASASAPGAPMRRQCCQCCQCILFSFSQLTMSFALPFGSGSSLGSLRSDELSRIVALTVCVCVISTTYKLIRHYMLQSILGLVIGP